MTQTITELPEYMEVYSIACDFVKCERYSMYTLHVVMYALKCKFAELLDVLSHTSKGLQGAMLLLVT